MQNTYNILSFMFVITRRFIYPEEDKDEDDDACHTKVEMAETRTAFLYN